VLGAGSVPRSIPRARPSTAKKGIAGPAHHSRSNANVGEKRSGGYDSVERGNGADLSAIHGSAEDSCIVQHNISVGGGANSCIIDDADDGENDRTEQESISYTQGSTSMSQSSVQPTPGKRKLANISATSSNDHDQDAWANGSYIAVGADGNPSPSFTGANNHANSTFNTTADDDSMEHVSFEEPQVLGSVTKRQRPSRGHTATATSTADAVQQQEIIKREQRIQQSQSTPGAPARASRRKGPAR
jgi:hypothetical protein